MKYGLLRRAPLVLALMLGGVAAPALAEVGIHLNLGGYPTLQRIPNYPVYYAPGVRSNYFFYDGLYWVFQDDDWYASSWYNGPWRLVDRYAVPDYILRVPVRYYRQAPVYFKSWRADAPPRWEERWGRPWVERRRDWDRWDHRSSPAPAPLPTYQRDYRGDRYPRAEEQRREIQSRSYRYRPHDPVAREHYDQSRIGGNVTNVRPGETIQDRNERVGSGG